MVSSKLKKLIMISICFTIIVMACGFSFLAIRLKSLKENSEVFDVSFTDVKMISSIKGGEMDPKGKIEITSLGKALDMNFDLYSEHDEMQYEIKIANNGTLSASIVDLFMMRDNDSLVNISLTDIGGKIIDPGEEVSVRLNVTYNALGSGVQERVAGDKNIKGKIGLLVESSTNK